MEYSVKSGNPEKQRTACLIISVFEPRRLSQRAQEVDKASAGYISNLLRRGDLEGKIGQTLLLHHLDGVVADRVLLVGCGKERDCDEQAYENIIGAAMFALKNTGAMDAANYLTELPIKSKDIAWRVQSAVQKIGADLYEFTQFKSEKKAERRPLRRMTLMVPTRRDLAQAEQALLVGEAVTQAICLSKDLANTPANACKPKDLQKAAEKLGSTYDSIQIATLEASDMKALGMGAFLSVAAGGTSEPKLITLDYRGARKDKKPIVFVGKGITFDTGGTSLKPPASMMGMKYDMCGAATVLGVMSACAALSLPINVIGVLAASENMIGPEATRPGDIITSMSGLTIEVKNTDAEGRLVLCDALTYVERYNPKAVIDIATLTGAISVALGRHASGLMSNSQALANDLLQAGQQSADRCWQLPIWPVYEETLKGPHADLSNIGEHAGAGSIVAGCFLAQFTKKYDWAHLDVAGTAAVMDGPERASTGRPIGLLMQYLLNACEQ